MLDDVGVVKAPENFDFPLYLIENSLLLNFLFVENLYRYFMVRNLIISH